MPEVSLNTNHQCTLDDPTDGADLPSAVPSVLTPHEIPTTLPLPPCLAQEPGAGGAATECTDELVRQFGGTQAAPPAPAPEHKASCLSDAVSVGTYCGKAAYEVLEKKYNALDIASCAGALLSLGLCEFKGD